MNITSHHFEDIKIAEIVTDDIILKTLDDGLDLLGNLYYQGFDKIIIYEKNITPDFFDLKNGIAGNVLQKFSQYRVPLAIIGDFSKYQSRSICEFIYESNKGKQINFAESLTEAINYLSK